MWNLPVKMLCRNHLLGEHFEVHILANQVSNNELKPGFIRNGLVEVHNIRKRHDELVEEMLSRGFNHKTPMTFSTDKVEGNIDVDKNLNTILNRCEKCRKRHESND
jgi:hypothetical protein